MEIWTSLHLGLQRPTPLLVRILLLWNSLFDILLKIGFGNATTSNANPFGQSQLFGKPTSGFGATATPAFGQPTGTSLFPSTQSQPTNLFQNANTTFGAQPTTQTGFGNYSYTLSLWESN